MTRTSKAERTSWVFIIQLPTCAHTAGRAGLRWQLDSKARHRAHQICASCPCRWAAGVQHQRKAAAHPATLLIIGLAGLSLSTHQSWIVQKISADFHGRSKAKSEGSGIWVLKSIPHLNWLLEMKNLQNHQKPVWKQIRTFSHPLWLGEVSGYQTSPQTCSMHHGYLDQYLNCVKIWDAPRNTYTSPTPCIVSIIIVTRPIGAANDRFRK